MPADDPLWLDRYLAAGEVLDVAVIRAGSLRGCPRVAGACPACGVESLGLAAGGYVTCANLSCPNPSAASEALRA